MHDEYIKSTLYFILFIFLDILKAMSIVSLIQVTDYRKNLFQFARTLYPNKALVWFVLIIITIHLCDNTLFFY